MNAGTDKIHSSVKKTIECISTNKTEDSNGDSIRISKRESWDYGHLAGFEKRHLESFSSELGMSQRELSEIINSTIMLEIQNRTVNRSHIAEEFDYSESMREILMATLEHLPKEKIVEKLFVDANGTDVLFESDDSVLINITPTNSTQIVSERAKKAFEFDVKNQGNKMQ